MSWKRTGKFGEKGEPSNRAKILVESQLQRRTNPKTQKTINVCGAVAGKKKSSKRTKAETSGCEKTVLSSVSRDIGSGKQTRGKKKDRVHLEGRQGEGKEGGETWFSSTKIEVERV